MTLPVPPRRTAIAAILALGLAGMLSVATPSWAQAFRQRGVQLETNVPYDGRFTFARIRYTVYRRSGWEYDYPTMERNLMSMMRTITSLRPHVRESNIHTLDDPDLMRYPIAYLSEPSYWIPSDAEAEGLRTYLAKGGFLIVDDFMRGEWYNFEQSMRKVLPNARIDRLDVSHKIFDSFFRLTSLDMTYPHDQGLKAEFLGIHQDNDKSTRLMVIINYNNDIGDYYGALGPGLVAGEHEQRRVQAGD